jgi:hypothetical protein
MERPKFKSHKLQFIVVFLFKIAIKCKNVLGEIRTRAFDLFGRNSLPLHHMKLLI